MPVSEDAPSDSPPNPVPALGFEPCAKPLSRRASLSRPIRQWPGRPPSAARGSGAAAFRPVLAETSASTSPPDTECVCVCSAL